MNADDFSLPVRFTDNECKLRRHESGDMRRTVLLDKRITDQPMVVETAPVLWGLSTVQHSHRVEWDYSDSTLRLEGDQVYRSLAPWQRRNNPSQTVQVIYCDDAIKVTMQSNDITVPTVYTLWKRASPTIYKKY